eukprot:9475772-Pyramimonas_sp.AAC.1
MIDREIEGGARGCDPELIEQARELVQQRMGVLQPFGTSSRGAADGGQKPAQHTAAGHVRGPPLSQSDR